MTGEYRYIQQCTEYMEENNLSQGRMAGKIGISESTFSRYLSGNYPKPDSVEDKIRALFEKEEKRQIHSSIADINFVMTSISQRVISVLEYSRLQGLIGVIYGDAGIGKTFTCRHWMNDKPDVVMITANPAFANPRSFLKLLSRGLKLNTSGSIDDMLLDIYSNLNQADKTIIIDEAQHLTRRTLEIVRSINDATETAIVLVGNDIIYSKLKGKQQAEFAQLFSRIGIRTKSLLTDMFRKEDIVVVFDEISSDNEATDFMLKISRSRYGLRGAVYTYNNAKNNQDTSYKGLAAMANLMGISV